MKLDYSSIVASLIFTLTLCFQTVNAQGAKKIPAKEASLIAPI